MGGKSLLLSGLRQLVVILPAAYLLSGIGLHYVWYAFPIAEAVSLAAGVWLFIRVYKGRIRYLQPNEVMGFAKHEAAPESAL